MIYIRCTHNRLLYRYCLIICIMLNRTLYVRYTVGYIVYLTMYITHNKHVIIYSMIYYVVSLYSTRAQKGITLQRRGAAHDVGVYEKAGWGDSPHTIVKFFPQLVKRPLKNFEKFSPNFSNVSYNIITILNMVFYYIIKYFLYSLLYIVFVMVIMFYFIPTDRYDFKCVVTILCIFETVL
jgi:hypothetical protein